MLEDLIFFLGPYWSVFLLAIVPGIMLFVWFYRYSGYNWRADSLYGKDPAPSEAPKWSTYPFGAWAQWRASIRAPKLFVLGRDVAYIGHQALSMDNTHAVIRSDIDYYRKRFIAFYFIGFAAIVGGGQTLIEYEKFYNRGPVCNHIEIIEGEKKRNYPAQGNSIFDYLKEMKCNIERPVLLAIKFKENVTDALVTAVLHTDVFSLILFVLSFSILLYLSLRRNPPPLVFDRKRRLVYTFRHGRVWLCDWDALSTSTVFEIFRRRGLGVRLYAEDGKGGWEPRWFSVATHYYWAEMPPIELWNEHMMDREGRVICHQVWLLRYMELGPQAVHAVLPFTGVMDWLLPRAGRLPGDLEDRVDALLAAQGGKAPGDEIFRDVEASSRIKKLLRDPDRFDPEKFIVSFLRGRYRRSLEAARSNAAGSGG